MVKKSEKIHREVNASGPFPRLSRISVRKNEKLDIEEIALLSTNNSCIGIEKYKQKPTRSDTLRYLRKLLILGKRSA